MSTMQVLCIAIPGVICAGAVVKMEKQIMAFVTAALGAVLMVKGFDFLIPVLKCCGDVSHIHADITPNAISADHWLLVSRRHVSTYALHSGSHCPNRCVSNSLKVCWWRLRENSWRRLCC